MSSALNRRRVWRGVFALATAACLVTGCVTMHEREPRPEWKKSPVAETRAVQEEKIMEACLKKWNYEESHLAYLHSENRISWYACLPTSRKNNREWITSIDLEIMKKVKRCKADPRRRECLDSCIANPGHIWCDDCEAQPNEYSCRQRRCMENPNLSGCEDVVIPKPETSLMFTDDGVMTYYHDDINTVQSTGELPWSDVDELAISYFLLGPCNEQAGMGPG